MQREVEIVDDGFRDRGDMDYFNALKNLQSFVGCYEKNVGCEMDVSNNTTVRSINSSTTTDDSLLNKGDFHFFS